MSDLIKTERHPNNGKRTLWFCRECNRWVQGNEVTYEETHDPRFGGCGQPVE